MDSLNKGGADRRGDLKVFNTYLLTLFDLFPIPSSKAD